VLPVLRYGRLNPEAVSAALDSFWLTPNLFMPTMIFHDHANLTMISGVHCGRMMKHRQVQVRWRKGHGTRCHWETIPFCGGWNMPEISRFYGIIIAMFFEDHNPPHFHARYGKEWVVIEIRTLRVLRVKFLPERWALWSNGLLSIKKNCSETGSMLARLSHWRRRGSRWHRMLFQRPI